MMHVLKNHLRFFHRIFSSEFFAENMLRFSSSFMAFVYSCVSYVFGVITKYTLRYKSCDKVELEQSVDVGKNYEDNDGKINEEFGGLLGLESDLATSTSKYQFASGKDIIGFIEKPENVCFSVQECCFLTSDDLSFNSSQLCDKEVFAENNYQEFVVNDQIIDQGKFVETLGSFSSKDDSGKDKDGVFVEDNVSVVGEVLDLEDSILGNRVCSDHSESESVGSSYEFVRCDDREAGFLKYEFLPGRHFGKKLDFESSAVTEMKVEEDEGTEMGKDFCILDRGVSEANGTFLIEKNDGDDEEEPPLKLDQYLQNDIGLAGEKFLDEDNCKVGLVHQEKTMIGTSDEAKEPKLEEELYVYDDRYGEHVELFTKFQKSIELDAEKSLVYEKYKINLAHQKAEVIEILDEATEPNLQEKISVHGDYDEQLLTLDQLLGDTFELDAEKLTGDYLCETISDHQKSEELQISDEGIQSGLQGKLSSYDDSNEELSRVHQYSQKSIQEDVGHASICEGNLLNPEADVIGTFYETMEPIFHGNKSVYDVDDSDDMDQDHDDLIHQLKAELNRVRTGGLPTILEESESPKVEADYLRPLEIDQKFEHKDRMKEIKKVYKIYADKMRKLDMLNYQALNAISLYQKKEPNCLNSSRKPFNLAVSFFLPQKISLHKALKVAADPILKSVENLHKDLEMVYVGQLCLSWEILCWEYWKARELQEDDSHGFHQYNGVANEFQLFQVLIQRFLEDEPFQGPRVTNYANNRCSLRSILQVPAIKDDSSKDQRFHKGMKRTDVVTIGELIGIIEASMQVFWKFLYADKDADLNSKRSHSSLVKLEDPTDSELLHSIRTGLQKKEKRLRDILRSGNCMIKRFQKHRRSDQSHRALFYAKVELKVISRVIHMSKLTTSQLLWCREKLESVDLDRNGVHVGSVFLLFPF